MKPIKMVDLQSIFTRQNNKMTAWIFTAIIAIILLRVWYLKKSNYIPKTASNLDIPSKMAFHKECFLQSTSHKEAKNHLDELKTLSSQLGVLWDSTDLEKLNQSKFETLGQLKKNKEDAKMIHQDGLFYDQEIELIDQLTPVEILDLEEKKGKASKKEKIALNLLLLKRYYSNSKTKEILETLEKSASTKQKLELEKLSQEYSEKVNKIHNASIDPKILKSLQLDLSNWEEKIIALFEDENVN